MTSRIEWCPEPLDVRSGLPELVEGSEHQGRESKGDTTRCNNLGTMPSSSQAMWFVYILRCADGALYTGETSNLDLRFAKHSDGSASRFTASRRPVTLVHSESYAGRDAALARERHLKCWTRAKKEALVAGDLVRLKQS